jgi:hypothetical protein
MTDSNRDNRLKTFDPQGVEGTTIPRADELDTTDLERDAVAGDVSPHFGRRAQPGDVLGLETGGETTGIGDTAEDEDERRHETEKDVAKVRESDLAEKKNR